MHRKKTIPLAVAAAALAAVPVAHADHQGAKGTKLSRGATTLAVDPAAAQALTGAGITVTPLKPAKATTDGLAFPITNGRLDTTTLTGTIKHVGGLRFAKGTTTFDARNFRIVLTPTAKSLTATVADKRIVVADLDTSGATVTPSTTTKSQRSHSARAAKHTRTTLTISGIKATLSQAGADGLNTAFGTTAFTAGAPLGTLTISSRTVGKGTGTGNGKSDAGSHHANHGQRNHGHGNGKGHGNS
jgi:hypothetical protein